MCVCVSCVCVYVCVCVFARARALKSKIKSKLYVEFNSRLTSKLRKLSMKSETDTEAYRQRGLQAGRVQTLRQTDRQVPGTGCLSV